jgi:RNA polymerase sigma-70 factor (ECF subfamily)
LDSLALALENDNQIISEYVSGNKDIAATAFVRKYQKFVYSVALRYIKDEDDAYDVSQDVFIKALNNLHKFRQESSIKTWLYKITANTSKTHLRKKKLMTFFKLNDSEEADIENLQIRAHAKEGIPVLGAAKIDVSGKMRGIDFIAGGEQFFIHKIITLLK